jgi:hypothetical protein
MGSSRAREKDIYQELISNPLNSGIRANTNTSPDGTGAGLGNHNLYIYALLLDR